MSAPPVSPRADSQEAQANGGAGVQEVSPDTNRGGTVTWGGIHWLTGTCQRDPEEVKAIVSRHLFGLPLVDRETGIWTYQRKAVESGSRAFVAWTPERRELVVNLPGDACEMLGTVGLIELVAELRLKITRLDMAWDTSLMTPGEVSAAHEAGDAVSHSKWHDWRKNPKGTTFYIGKRGSDEDGRLVRFYDRRGPTRVELELHKKRADAFWTLLQDYEIPQWSPIGLAYLVDFVDFRHRAADSNVGRCPRLAWWEDFAQGASRLALPLPRTAPTLETTENWMEHGVSASLATVADAQPDPEKYIRGLVERGRSRRTARHTALLDVTRAVQAARALNRSG